MSHTKNIELLKLQNSASETNTDNNKSGNTELIERHRVANTAFEICGSIEIGYFIAMGKYRLTAPKKTKEECLIMIAEKDYELLLGLMGATLLSEYTQQERELIAQVRKSIGADFITYNENNGEELIIGKKHIPDGAKETARAMNQQ